MSNYLYEYARLIQDALGLDTYTFSKSRQQQARFQIENIRSELYYTGLTDSESPNEISVVLDNLEKLLIDYDKDPEKVFSVLYEITDVLCGQLDVNHKRADQTKFKKPIIEPSVTQEGEEMIFDESEYDFEIQDALTGQINEIY